MSKSRRNKTIIIRGSRLNYNASVQSKYVRQLKKLVRRMTKETNNEITNLFKSQEAKDFREQQKESSAMDASIASQAKILTNYLSKKFNSLFSEKAKPLAESMVNDADKISRISLSESLKKLSGGVTIKTNFMTAGLNEITKAVVIENVALIKSISNQYLSKVQKQVMRSITNGEGISELIPKIQKYNGITERQAKNIALDQTRKAYNAINKGRMEKVGVKRFEWIHSGGGQHPRPDHIAMNGNIYSFDNLPVIEKNTGERGIPGQAINCKCTMIPVVEYNQIEE